MAPDAELVEVSPGRWRDFALCSEQDLEGARDLAAERLRKSSGGTELLGSSEGAEVLSVGKRGGV